MDDRQIYDVLIVGAGPVGLATAIALYHRGIHNILVIDQARSFRRVGQVVDILPNGLKALQCIDPKTYQTIKAVGLDFLQKRRAKSEAGKPSAPQKRFWESKNLKGELIRSVPLEFEDWFDNYGEGRISIPWYDLQTHLRQLLPSELVKVNHCCTNLISHQSSVFVECTSDEAFSNPFAHWRMQSTAQSDPSESETPARPSSAQFEAKLVVAADGINSTVRQWLYHDSPFEVWGKPPYSGFGAIGCLHIENVPDALMQSLEAQYFQGQSVVTIQNDGLSSQGSACAWQEVPTASPRLILICRGANALGYLLHAPIDFRLLHEQPPAALIQLASDLLRDAAFPPLLLQVIQQSDPERLLNRPYYIHPTHLDYSEPLWSRDRLVLVGDAAHGMPPFAAQGANQGLEDAAMVGVAIANLIQEQALENLPRISQQFQQYERLRRPFLEKVQTATLHNHDWSQDEWERFCDEVYRRDIQDCVERCLA